MKAKYYYILISLSLVFLTSCQRGGGLTDADRSRIKQEVLEVQHQMIRATENRNVEAMFSYILDNEGVIIQNGLFHKSHQDALNYTKTGLANIAKLEYQFDPEVIEVLSPDKVLLKASGMSTAQTSDGREFKTPFCETAVYTLTPDGWKILHAHQSTPVR